MLLEEFKEGLKVVHTSHKEWGIGEVVKVYHDGVLIYFGERPKHVCNSNIFMYYVEELKYFEENKHG